MAKFIVVVITLVCLAPRITICTQTSQEAPTTMAAGCKAHCGDVKVPFPFGIGPGCSIDEEWFEIFCDNSTTSHTPFLRKLGVQVLDISTEGTLRVTNPITSQNCTDTTPTKALNLTRSPFVFSEKHNRFNAVSCGLFAYMKSTLNSSYVHTGCTSICSLDNKNMSMSSTSIPSYTHERKNRCDGLDCCHTTIPFDTKAFKIDFLDEDFANDTDNDMKGKDGCKYAFVVDKSWLRDNSTQAFLPGVLMNRTHVPVVLNWYLLRNFDYARSLEDRLKCSTSNSTIYCSISPSRSTRHENIFSCSCRKGYEGNPYLPHGCQDIDECKRDSKTCRRHGDICVNLPGSYKCIKDPQRLAKTVPKVIGFGAGIGFLVTIVAALWLYKIFIKRKDIKRKEKFFKRNGGLLLQKKIYSPSDQVSMDRTKLFTAKELDKATDHFNVDRILGQGGQGTVFKGMLADGRIVAVKSSKIVDEAKLTEFINEVLILSQINHRNVVQLLGCCLETDVPLLVYEFVPNGNLYQLIHDLNLEFPFTWEMRMRIATEVAGSLSYLHSAASSPIYHRDIKSTNILLDGKYKAKVADFGTSRSVSVDQTHLTTLVHGTFGYLDPEYCRSSQFTEKSDVYSFGVVLVELLTGQKAVYVTQSQEGRSLVAYFVDSMEEDHLFEILDNEVMKGPREEIMVVANLARKCLNWSGRDRPPMKEVVLVLEGTQMLENDSYSAQPTENCNVSVSIENCDDSVSEEDATF